MKKTSFIILAVLIFSISAVIISCNKDASPVPQGTPVLASALVNITSSEATVTGTLLSGGGISEWGVCWSTEPAPATDGAKVTVPVEGSTFRIVLSDLDPLRVYYVRCYAVNDEGTTYGNELSFLSGDMELTAREIPDTAFRRILLRAGDLDGDGRLMASEAATVATLEVLNNDIVSLEGIRYLYDLRQLTLTGEKIRVVKDVPHLTSLRCWTRQTSLRISDCPALEEVESYSSEWLDSLYIGHCQKLNRIDCSDCKLSVLDVVDLPGLRELICAQNRLSTLDLSGCPALEELNCYANQLSALEIGAQARLLDLNCSDNLLSTLDLSGCPMLRNLFCDNNKLAVLDVGTLKGLLRLWCCDNLISALDLSGCPKLRYLYCDGNQLAMLDTEVLPDLRELHCSNNLFATLDLRGCPKLRYLRCDGNQLAMLDTEALPDLCGLHCSNNLFAALNVSSCPKLQELACNDNKLTILDISANPQLYNLFCAGNLLTTLDVSKCPKLEEVDCDRNVSLATVLVSTEQAALQDARGNIPDWTIPGTAAYHVAP